VCGEQSFCYFLVNPSIGSPPRVRGTGLEDAAQVRRRRITPACAGNSRYRYCQPLKAADHPRVCGEQHRETEGRHSGHGSPPRVRGTVRLHRLHRHQIRITPACAGNRSTASWGLPPVSDHPRVCGEQWACYSLQSLAQGSPRVCGEQVDMLLPCLGNQGSPPRVRGTVGGVVGYLINLRITPACAGNRRPTW